MTAWALKTYDDAHEAEGNVKWFGRFFLNRDEATALKVFSRPEPDGRWSLLVRLPWPLESDAVLALPGWQEVVDPDLAGWTQRA
jgi:hypothetical protein